MAQPYMDIIDSQYQIDSPVVQDTNGQSFFIKGVQISAFQLNATNATPAAVIVASADIDDTTDKFHSVAHGFPTGLKVQVSTDGALPTPLLVLTNYFVIRNDADHFQLASSLVNALAGTQIDLSDAGTGNQTVTPVALSASAQMEKSLDGSQWFIEGSSQSISGSTSLYFEKASPSGKYMRLKISLTSGYMTVNSYALGKGTL